MSIKNKNKLPSPITLLILTAITVIFWAGFGVYSAFSSPPKIDIPEEILKDINPKLDISTLDEIVKRTYYEK